MNARTKHAEATETVDLAEEAMEVFASQIAPLTAYFKRHTSCPIPYEIKGNRIYVRGEDWGNAETFFAEGSRLVELVSHCHGIRTACA